MIAPRRETGGLRAVTLGLRPEEQTLLFDCVDRVRGKLIHTASNLDLWDNARGESVDLCVIGQCEAIPDPVYLAWLMRGLSRYCRVVLVFDPMTEEARRLFGPLRSILVLERPLDPDRIVDIVREAGIRRAFDMENLADAVGFQIPIRRVPAAEEVEIDS